jgi:hypothetical protein
MAKEKMSPALKEILMGQDSKKLVSIIQKQANKDTDFLYALKMEYEDKAELEEDLFEDYKSMVHSELNSFTRYKRQELHAFETINNAVKELNNFTKLCKNKKMEADILVMILDHSFKEYQDQLGTYFTKLDNKLFVTFQRLYNLVTKKLHPDLKIEYEEKIKGYYEVLNRECRHLDRVYNFKLEL